MAARSTIALLGLRVRLEENQNGRASGKVVALIGGGAAEAATRGPLQLAPDGLAWCNNESQPAAANTAGARSCHCASISERVTVVPIFAAGSGF